MMTRILTILLMVILGNLSIVFAQSQTAPMQAAPGDAAQRPMNVLFVVADDLRPELGCYDNAIIKSPNIDRLASRGMVFNRA